MAKLNGDYAYVTIGGENAVRIIKRGDPPQVVGTLPLGATPHGIWPSPDSSRLYIGLEDGDAVQVIDTASDQIVTTIPIGQAPQALVYVARGGATTTPAGLTSQGLGQPVVKAPLRTPDPASTARGTVTARRLGGVDQLTVDVDGLSAGTYRVLLTDTAQPPIGTALAVASFEVGAQQRGRAQSLLTAFDQEVDGARLDHVMVEDADGNIVLGDGGAEGLPGPLTRSLPPLGGPVDGASVQGSALGADRLGNVRAVAVTAGATSDGAWDEVRIFHRLGGQVVGVWRGPVSCVVQDGTTIMLTGVISVGEERAQHLDLGGRAFRLAVTDDSPTASGCR